MKQVNEVEQRQQHTTTTTFVMETTNNGHETMISDQQQLMSHSSATNGSRLSSKTSGLHLSFVGNANESVGSAFCKQCQIGKKSVVKFAKIFLC